MMMQRSNGLICFARQGGLKPPYKVLRLESFMLIVDGVIDKIIGFLYLLPISLIIMINFKDRTDYKTRK